MQASDSLRCPICSAEVTISENDSNWFVCSEPACGYDDFIQDPMSDWANAAG